MTSAGSRAPVHFVVFVTDRGPNEVYARKLWQVAAKDCPTIIVISCDCLEHASHLITLGALKLCDQLLHRHFQGQGQHGFKYFSSLATSSITIRDGSKSFFKHWAEVHGPQSAVKHAKTLWPRCLGGRWGSCHDVETRMRSSGAKRQCCQSWKRC